MYLKIGLFITVWGLSNNVLANFDVLQFNPKQQYCFSKAMVGMDSVINANLGTPPEHAVDLILTDGNVQALNNPNTVGMLNVILNAYFWTGSPHGYAIKVFYQCAESQAQKGKTIAHDSKN